MFFVSSPRSCLLVDACQCNSFLFLFCHILFFLLKHHVLAFFCFFFGHVVSVVSL